jgi:hypothetical protein
VNTSTITPDQLAAEYIEKVNMAIEDGDERTAYDLSGTYVTELNELFGPEVAARLLATSTASV